MTDDEKICHLVRLSESLLTTDRYTQAPSIENPTGLIHTDGQTLVSLAAAKLLSDLIEQAKAVSVPQPKEVS